MFAKGKGESITTGLVHDVSHWYKIIEGEESMERDSTTFSDT